jgi:hypothetical protein
VNQDSLSNIVNQNEQLNADVVIDLVQLCQSFPYFSLPYVLLSKHYALKHDFRTENTLFQAALRVSDREWMFQYIHKTNSLLAENQNILEVTVEKAIEAFEPPNPTTEVHSQSIEPTETSGTEPILETQSIDSELIFTHEPKSKSTFEIAFDTLDAVAEFEPQNSEIEQIESVFDPEIKLEGEIFKITETLYNSVQQEEFREETEEKMPVHEFNKEPESMLFIPSIEAETIIETSDLEVEKTNRTWLFDPDTDLQLNEGNTKSSEKENTAEPILEKSKPFKEIQFAAGYNIEDYFKIENVNAIEPEKPTFEPEVQNNDFFAWLNSGLSNQGPINKPKEVSKSVLIDKFIQENPSIQRPKQEFFSPEKAMKKSEVLDTNLATETLAKIYAMQGHPEKAIKVYNQLQLKFPEKLSYFASLINKIKQEHNL